nr:glycine dehydrogenase [Duffyella gerundensis]
MRFTRQWIFRFNRSDRVNNGAVSVSNTATPEQIQALADRVLGQINRLFAAQQISPNPVQQQMLASHVKAMALRSLTGEALPDVDADLFDEISPASIALAQQVVDLFGNLPVEEAWLLSVHIDVARENQ